MFYIESVVHRQLWPSALKFEGCVSLFAPELILVIDDNLDLPGSAGEQPAARWRIFDPHMSSLASIAPLVGVKFLGHMAENSSSRDDTDIVQDSCPELDKNLWF